MDTFDDMIAAAEPVEHKFKNYTAGNDKSRWANVFTTFFESIGVHTRRDSESASNIDAVENVAAKPQEFLLLMQRMFPGMFTFGEQTTQESAQDRFIDIIQEMLPIGDEERADLKRFLGRQITEHEIQAVLNEPQQLLQLIQQNFPEYNIQLEAVPAVLRTIGSGLATAGKNIAGYVKNKADEKGIWSKKKSTKDNMKNLAGKAAWGGLKHANKLTGKAIRGIDSALAPGGGDGRVNPGVFGQVMSSIPVGQSMDKGKNPDKDKNPDKKEVPEQPQIKKGPAFSTAWDQARLKTSAGLETFLKNNYTLTDDQLKELMDLRNDGAKNNPGTTISDIAARAIHNRLQQLNLAEHTLHMDTFSKMIQDTGYPIVEAPEDETLPPEPTPGAEVPEAPAAPTPDQSVELEPNDLDKLQVDMLELVRKALIINPKDIDSEAYMKITTAVDFNNLMELRPLLTKLVQNHYPDLEMDEVTPGPGV